MKVYYPLQLLTVVAMTTVVTIEAQITPRSLEGLLSEFVRRAMADAHEIFQNISPQFNDLDWSNDNDSHNALSNVPCNLLCNVCWEWEVQLVSSQCENHCVNTCHWNFKTKENTRLARGLFDFCIGFPDGVRVNFGGIGKLLSKIPLLGSLIGK